MNFTVRPEAAADAGAVHALLARAFETPAEADLVDQLRRDGDLLLALVATDARAAGLRAPAQGARAVARASARRGDRHTRARARPTGGEWPAVGLAPLAVAEAQRRGGIGAALVRAGLARLAAQGETLVFVMGNPAYYTRLGFALATAQRFTCVYAGPYFMALRLGESAPRAGTVRYPAAFDDLG